jgi:vacuolar-type H+-ATPase subunit F/Vma7
MSGEGVVVVIPTELENGFQLAGVETVPAATAEDAIDQVERIVDESMRGVIAVYEPFLAGASPTRRAVFDASVSPVIVPLPAGLEERDEESHRVRISAMLSRAVGYHITFGEEIPR